MPNQIEQYIIDFNSCWTEGDLDRLSPLLHHKAIFLAPDLKTEIVGKEACLKTIKEYVQNASTKSFKVLSQKIRTWQSTTVVTLQYFIEYNMNEEVYTEKATEFWTLTYEGNCWRMVWRAMVNNESA